MYYNLYKNGKYANGIVASEDFINEYCRENGYTYKKVEQEEKKNHFPEQNPNLPDQRIIAVSDRIDFLEDCIAEMAVQIYSN